MTGRAGLTGGPRPGSAELARSSPRGSWLTPSSPVVRAARLVIVPMAALALVPVLLTELHFFPIRDLVGATIPDTIYLEHAAQGLVQGHQPYGTNFLTAPDGRLVFVYPPLSLLLALPALLAGADYSFGLALELLVLLGLGLWLLGWGCRRSGISFPAVLLIGLLLLAMGPVLVTRVDALQGLALAGAALALRSRRTALAVALVALATLAKETVVVAALPVVVWSLWPPPGSRWRSGLGHRVGAVLLGLIPAATLLLIFGIWSAGRVLNSAGASINRGVEIESVPAVISALLRPIFPLTVSTGKLASVQVSGAEVTWVATVVALVGVAALVWGAVHFARARCQPATAIAFALAVGLAATPVFSPQYLLSLMPVLVLAACTEVGPARGRLLLLLGLLLGLLTQVEFPYLFSSVDVLAPLGTAVVVARNLLLIVTAVTLARSHPAPPAESNRAASPR